MCEHQLFNNLKRWILSLAFLSLFVLIHIKPFFAQQTQTVTTTTTFQLIDNFETLNIGLIHGQNGWQTTTDSSVTVDPQEVSNRVLHLSANGADQGAYKALPMPLPNTERGTLHFRLRRAGHLDGFVGLADVAAPTNWSDYETQFGSQTSQPADQFVARNGGDFTRLAAGFADHTWYCVWLVIDNSTDQFSAYVQGGTYSSPTRIGDSLRFRNGTNDALHTFYVRTDGRTQGDLLLDDIYFDSSGQNLASPSTACGTPPPPTPPSPTVPTSTSTPMSATPTAQPPRQGFQVVDNFDALPLGSISGRNGWKTADGIDVISDPQEVSNRVLQLSATGADQGAYKALPMPLPNTERGTLHFRLRRAGHLDGFVGLADVAAPTNWSDYETQFGSQTSQPADRFVARNGGDFTGLAAGFADHTWYCVWLVIDNSTDRFSAYVQGGTYSSPTRIGDSLRFRNGTNDALHTFYVRTDGRTQGDLLLDDIYFDSSGQNLASPSTACGTPPPPTPPTPVLTPPTPAPTVVQGFQKVDDFETLPTGILQGRGGWQATSGAQIAIDPHNANNRVLQLLANSNVQDAYKALSIPLGESSTGTLYLRLRRDGHLDGFAGTSASRAPNDWSNFEAQFGSQTTQMADQFIARNGGDFDALAGGFNERTWYCVWLIMDNSRDRYNTYVQGGSYRGPTRISEDLALRNGGNTPLYTFYTRLDARTHSSLWLDDIYIDPTSQNLSAPGSGCNTTNQAPNANEDRYQTAKNTTLNGASILTNDSDPDGDQLRLETTPIQTTQNGDLILNPNGTFHYKPQPTYIGDDSFTYRICDNGAPVLCDEAQVYISIVEDNTPPIATDDYFTVDRNSSNNVFDVLRNDTNHSGELLTITALGTPSRGGAVTQNGERLLYTPAVDFAGEEQFSYTVSASNGSSDSAIVYITIADRAVINLTVDNLEVSQSIQTMGNNVPLVARRPALARVYIGVQNTTEAVRGVTAQLHGLHNGRSLAGSPLSPINHEGQITAYPTPDREAIGQTLNFSLPLEWLTAGQLTLRAEVNPDRTIQEINDNDNEHSSTLTVYTVPPMELVLIPIAYQRNGQGPIYRPSLNEYNKLGLGMLQDIFPIHEVRYQIHPEFYYNGDLSTDWGWEDLLRKLAQLRLQERPYEPVYNTGATILPKYYGVLPMEASFWGGMAYLPGTVGMGLVNQDDVAAHELGHNLGLHHVESTVCNRYPSSIDRTYPYPNSTIGNVGIHVLKVKTIPANYHDFMSYCWPKWISDYHYNKVLTVLRSVRSGAVGAAMAGAPEERLLVSGRIAPGNAEGTLNHALPVTTAPPIDAIEPGAFAIKLLDSAGTVQHTLSFDPASIINEGETESPADFGFALPRIAALSQVQLWHQNTLLATLQAKAAPKLSAAFTEDPDQPTKIKITWEVADRADTYVNLRYSPDNGTSWQILALQLDGSSYILDTTKIPGSDSGLVEIVANSTTDASAMRLAIGQVKDKVPLVAILQSNQREFAPGEAIVLFGAAVDFEDGSLTDQSLTWFNASNEILGTGNQLIIPQGLPTGKHTIFLRAIDSAQRIAITNIDIVVGDQQEIFLPIISR